jgi:hypothetical protein
MSTPKAQLTVQLDNGEMFTGTHAQWSEITGDTVATIQKRCSERNRQVREGVRAYTWREVVGLDKLKRIAGNRTPLVEKRNNTELVNGFIRRRLVC